jgi:Microcystin-dependent protein
MSTPYVGEIRLFPYTFAPVGWQLCDGSLLGIADYEVLYTLIGTTFGGNGTTTFGVPDLRGRVPVHQGTGSGLSPRVMGELNGTESVTLISAQMPAHTHNFAATSGTATINSPGSTVELGGLSTTDTMYTSTVTGSGAATSNTAISQSGSSLPHENLMPTLTATFCIAVNGIFPSQN